ncbi:hypothetical protein [Streptomyces anulatus]|uniref:hypothetical protein n=1 Tax=Streptomyces anulatus TaxID=1892 RepID=UPI00341ACC86
MTEDRNDDVVNPAGGGATWRSLSGVTEDRNDIHMFTARLVKGWRSPSGAAKDRNYINTVSLDGHHKVVVAPEDRNLLPCVNNGLLGGGGRLPGVTEDRNLADGKVPGTKAAVAVALQGDRGSQRQRHDEFPLAQLVAVALRGDRGSQLILLGLTHRPRLVWRSPSGAAEDCNSRNLGGGWACTPVAVAHRAT